MAACAAIWLADSPWPCCILRFVPELLFDALDIVGSKKPWLRWRARWPGTQLLPPTILSVGLAALALDTDKPDSFGTGRGSGREKDCTDVLLAFRAGWA